MKKEMIIAILIGVTLLIFGFFVGWKVASWEKLTGEIPVSGQQEGNIPGVPSITTNPSTNQTAPSLSWDECIKIKRSRVLQTYPNQCVTPDGRRAIEPIGR